MTEPIRAAVIGFGNGGRTFHAAFISAVPGFELAAIVQRKGDEAAQAYPKAKIYRSVEGDARRREHPAGFGYYIQPDAC